MSTLWFIISLGIILVLLTLIEIFLYFAKRNRKKYGQTKTWKEK